MKRRSKKLKEIKIPSKINEIISYLSFTFSSKVLEREDNKQDLYTLYISTIRNKPSTESQDPGWWFIKFKWFLLTRYAKEIKRINKEWEHIHETELSGTKYNGNDQEQSDVGLVPDDRLPEEE